MKKLIIFDFNRTIYDPDTDLLVLGAIEILNDLHSRMFSCALVSRKEVGREDVLKRFGIDKFFISVSFVLQKSKQIFEQIAEKHGVKPEYTYVVGDYLHEEIRFGNRALMRTIWLKQGRFSNLTPESSDDIPWKTITNLKELQKIIT